MLERYYYLYGVCARIMTDTVLTYSVTVVEYIIYMKGHSSSRYDADGNVYQACMYMCRWAILRFLFLVESHLISPPVVLSFSYYIIIVTQIRSFTAGAPPLSLLRFGPCLLTR